ncbi:MAG: CvpA family protein [Spirochaetota bacterium]
MSVIDWVFAGVVILLTARCFVRGFVQEMLSVASYAVGLISGLVFANSLVDLATKRLGTFDLPSTVLYVIAFIVCFLLGFLAMKLIEKLIREGLEAARLEIFDKLLGLALGAAEGLAVVALALIVLDIQPFFDASKLLSDSLFGSTILPLVGPAINQAMKPALEGGSLNLDLKGILKGKGK